MLDLASLLPRVVSLALRAGEAVMRVYAKPIEVYEKADESPLTEADLAAHRCIVTGLAEFGIPVLSEESDAISSAERLSWSRFWLVDPLDGTKEFIGRSGEFTVNIALIDEGVPILGVVHAPAVGVTYSACRGVGAFRGSDPIHVAPISSGALRVVASRRHAGAETEAYLQGLGREIEVLSIGSSLKLCMVADGQADLYPRLGRTMEWDTAAADAIVREAGGSVKDLGGDPLKYGKENLLNPYFVVSNEP